MSNFYCHPARGGGLPCLARICADCREKFDVDPAVEHHYPGYCGLCVTEREEQDKATVVVEHADGTRPDLEMARRYNICFAVAIKGGRCLLRAMV